LSNNNEYTGIMQETDNDFELVRKFISGDESSFNSIVRKYQEKIYWHSRRMTGNHLDADEVVQEVLIVLYKKLKDFQFRSSLYTWIYRITTTRSINFIRKRSVKNLISIEDKAAESLKEKNDIIHDIEVKEKVRRIEKNLQKIPVKQREVFILRNMENLSYEEISEITGKSIGGLKANYFHAVKKLMEMMKNE
jgi:RNA polymerase sigma-70 factor (ECF subfamily)